MAAPSPRRRFTVGIRDDVSGRSLDVDPDFDLEPDDVTRALFFGLGADGTVSANKASIKIIGEETPPSRRGTSSTTRASRARRRSRTCASARGPSARPTACSAPSSSPCTTRSFSSAGTCFAAAMPGATVLLNTPVAPEAVWDTLPARGPTAARVAGLQALRHRRLRRRGARGPRAAHQHRDAGLLLRAVRRTARGRGDAAPPALGGRHLGPARPEEVVRRNVEALDAALAALHEVPVPSAATSVRLRPRPCPPTRPTSCSASRGSPRRPRRRAPGERVPPDGTWPSARASTRSAPSPGTSPSGSPTSACSATSAR
jgi:pyruvate-ferredoxin/flavodoxin oxidoreductase